MIAAIYARKSTDQAGAGDKTSVNHPPSPQDFTGWPSSLTAGVDSVHGALGPSNHWGRYF